MTFSSICHVTMAVILYFVVSFVFALICGAVMGSADEAEL